MYLVYLFIMKFSCHNANFWLAKVTQHGSAAVEEVDTAMTVLNFLLLIARIAL